MDGLTRYIPLPSSSWESHPSAIDGCHVSLQWVIEKNSCPGDGGSGEQGAASSSSSKSGQLPSAGAGRVGRAAAAAAADCSIGAGTDRPCEDARTDPTHCCAFLPFNLASSRFVCHRLGLLQFWPFPSSLVTANYEDPSTVSARLLPTPDKGQLASSPRGTTPWQ